MIEDLATQLEGRDKENKTLNEQVTNLNLVITKNCEQITKYQEAAAQARSEAVGLKKMLQTMNLQMSANKK